VKRKPDLVVAQLRKEAGGGKPGCALHDSFEAHCRSAQNPGLAVDLVLDETLQFPGFAPMDNLKAKVSARARNLSVADLAKHNIVAALNPIYLAGPGQFLQLRCYVNPDAAC
jgi:hypothetical protein